MKKNNQIKFLILFLTFIFLVTSGFSCGQSPASSQPEITLKYWRVWDDQDDFQSIISAYRAIHPNVKVEYRKFRYEEYEQALLEAFAEDRGPDIFSIHNTWVNKYRSKLLPAPDSVTLPYEKTVTHLGFKEEKVVEMKPTRLISPVQVKDKFIDVVHQDVIWPDSGDNNKEKVYALPLSVDTLVLFYNRDLLNSAGIPEPAQTWTEFQSHVKTIVKQDKQGDIIQAGAAIGTGHNVSRSFDILSLLMMQNGTPMVSNGKVTLATKLEGRETSPAEEALIFYADFAYPAKEVYTWNEEMPNSLEAFIGGQVAYFFGYAYNLRDIRNRAPKLNFSYSKLPQIEGNPEINYANYWVEAVAKKTEHSDWAWDFLQFATSEEQVKSYLDKAEKPTALRSLINYQIEKEDLIPFILQLLTAKSWYRGQDSAKAENIFKEMITAVVNSEMFVEEAIELAAGRIQQTM